MNLSRYASNVSRLADELISDFAESDIQALSVDLAAIGLRPWVMWQKDHHDEINAFLEATPAERKRKAIWRDPRQFRRLSLAAWERATESAVLLRALSEESDALPWPDLPYRTVAHEASEIFWLLSVAMDSVPCWPFEDETFPFQNAESAP